MREYSNRITDAHLSRLGPAKASAGDIGKQDDLLVAKLIGNRRKVSVCIGDEQVFGLGPIDRVSKPPATKGLISFAVTALG